MLEGQAELRIKAQTATIVRLRLLLWQRAAAVALDIILLLEPLMREAGALEAVELMTALLETGLLDKGIMVVPATALQAAAVVAGLLWEPTRVQLRGAMEARA